MVGLSAPWFCLVRTHGSARQGSAWRLLLATLYVVSMAGAAGPLALRAGEALDGATCQAGFRWLLNGKDLTGWEGGGGRDAALCWRVENEMLVCTGQKGPWLRSKDEFADFNLRLEYRLKPGGNSGVYVRVPESGAHRDPGDGVEIQILDDDATRYAALKPYQYSGSVYAIVPARQHVGRRPGEWNTLEINCVGTSYRVTHNGVVVVDADEKQFPELAQRRVKGYLGLQNHKEEVWFRHVRLGPPRVTRARARLKNDE